MISIIIPAFNEAKNLPILRGRLIEILEGLEIPWEVIIVDDHSSDATFAVLQEMASRDKRIRGFRLSRNFGSHNAIFCGLEQVRGDCAAVLAADLQDPPEIIPQMLSKCREGAQVVWAVRRNRGGEKIATLQFSKLYYFIMRRLVGIKQMPATGADFFLINRQVINALLKFKERNMSIFALLTWMGFDQRTIDYDKEERKHGRSGWTLRKKVKLLIDSVTSFSFFPIHLMTCLGFAIAILGFIYATAVITNAFIGKPAEGWSSLMIVVLIIGGIQMIMVGMLGEYLWRTLDETRRRPQYLIEKSTDTEIGSERKNVSSRESL